MSDLLLTRAVQANVGFSLLSGGTLLLGAPWLTDLLGPPIWALAVVGGGVVAFGLSLWRGLAKDPVATGRTAVVADLAWVLATVGLAPVVADAFTVTGGWVAIVIAVVVADLAVLEWIGVRRAVA